MTHNVDIVNCAAREADETCNHFESPGSMRFGITTTHRCHKENRHDRGTSAGTDHHSLRLKMQNEGSRQYNFVDLTDSKRRTEQNRTFEPWLRREFHLGESKVVRVPPPSPPLVGCWGDSLACTVPLPAWPSTVTGAAPPGNRSALCMQHLHAPFVSVLHV